MIEPTTMSKEHATILGIAKDILDHIASDDFDVLTVVKLRWRMAHILAVHLAKEDKILYPKLKTDADQRLARLATAFEEEMGNLAAGYHAYMAAWSGEAIAADRAAFCNDTARIMALLGRRIDKEERELYPLYMASLSNRHAPALAQRATG